MASSVIGAGLKKAQGGLSQFSKLATVGFAAVAAASAAAGAAFAVAGKQAIDTADNMSKAAQKVGLTTEALSRLNHAAGYSDVSLEQLSGGLQKLSKNLADVASGKGGAAATALQALGISATDATGKLRGSDEVFTEIADRFSRLEDGSTKTALAMQLFGRTGADLIPLLNSGKAALKAYADESDRFGLTISTKTGRAAEKFNDTLTHVGRILQGLVQKVTAAALPALQRLADMLASPEFASAAEAMGTALIDQMTKIIEFISRAQESWEGFVDFMNRGGRPKVYRVGSQNIEDRSTPGWLDRQRTAGQVVNSSFNALDGQTFGSVADMWKGMAPGGDGGFTPPNFGAGGGVTDALASRLDALRMSLMSEEQLELDSHSKRLAEIAKFYEQGLIKKGEFDSLTQAAQVEHSDRMAELVKAEEEKKAAIRDAAISGVASVFGSLGKLAEQFGAKNLAAAKAFGVAEAVINTAQGITKALTLPPPASWGQAAAVAAAGAAQIGTILSTSKGSTSKPMVGGASGDVGATAQQSSSRSISFNLQGDYFSASSFGSLVQRLNDELGIDGLQLVVNHKQA